NKHYPNGSQELHFGGAVYTVTALIALLQSFVQLREAVEAAQAAVKERLAAEHAQSPSLLAIIGAFEMFVRATFGNSPETLADFGIPPRKERTPLTAEQLVAAVARREATREARHTLGKQQRKAIKGAAVTVTVVKTPSAHG